MSTRVSLLAAGAVLLISLGLSACASAPGEEGAVAATDVNKVVCRREAETGSRLPKRTCKTQAEWDEIARENEETRRGLRRDPATGNASDDGLQ